MSRFCQSLLLTAALALTLANAGLVRSQPTNTTEITALAFTLDGKTVISASLDGTLRLWNVADGKEKQQVIAHKGGVYSGALSADGKFYVSAGVDEMVRLWHTATLKEVRVFKGHRGEVAAVAFSPDGKTLASGGADKTIRLWDVDSGKEKLTFHGHEVKVTSLSFSPDGKTLLSGGIGNVVIPGVFINAQHSDQASLWNVATGKQVRQLKQRGSQVALAPDGRTLAVGGLVIVGNGAGKRRNLNSGTKVEVGGVQLGGEGLTIAYQGGGLAFSGDGKFLATTWGSRQHLQHLGRWQPENQITHRQVVLWELATGKEALQIPEEGAPVVALSPDGKKLAAGRLYGGVVFHDLKPTRWNAEAAAKLTPAELERHWLDLSRDPAGNAYQALWALTAAGDKTVALFQTKLQPAKAGGAAAAKLIANLDSKTFKVRENAVRELKKLGTSVEPELRQALEKKSSDEVRQRVQKLLATMERRPGHLATVEELQQTRALQILERIGSGEARALMTRLAEGAPGAWLTIEAQGCLERLRRRN